MKNLKPGASVDGILTEEQIKRIRRIQAKIDEQREYLGLPALKLKKNSSSLKRFTEMPGVYKLVWQINGKRYSYVGEAASLSHRIESGHLKTVGIRLLGFLGHEPEILILETGNHLHDVSVRRNLELEHISQLLESGDEVLNLKL